MSHRWDSIRSARQAPEPADADAAAPTGLPQGAGAGTDGVDAEPAGDPAVRPARRADLDTAVILAFAPLHKAAFGVATGLLSGTVLALVTLADMVIDPQRRAPLALLGQYFYGYAVSPAGVVVAFFWGAFVGFVGGWFLAFARNIVMALWILYFRARADWLATHDFLDYI